VLKKLLNAAPFILLVLAGVWALCLYFFHTPLPPIGTYVAILAFGAALVTIWPPAENRGWAKAAWVLLFALLMGFEVHNLYRDRTEHDREQNAARRREDDRFAAILRQNQNEFEQTIKESRRLSLLEERALNNITGGESWPEVIPSFGLFPDRVVVSFAINVDSSAASGRRTPLRVLNIDIIRDTNVDESGNTVGDIVFHQVFDSFFGGYDPSYMTLQQELKGGQQVFDVRAYALNGFWHQTIKLRKIAGKWEWRSVLYVPGAKGPVEVRKVLRMRSSAAFPADDLKKPIQPVTLTDIGPR
jgi:hypothetical protein